MKLDAYAVRFMSTIQLMIIYYDCAFRCVSVQFRCISMRFDSMSLLFDICVNIDIKLTQDVLLYISEKRIKKVAYNQESIFLKQVGSLHQGCNETNKYVQMPSKWPGCIR